MEGLTGEELRLKNEQLQQRKRELGTDGPRNGHETKPCAAADSAESIVARIERQAAATQEVSDCGCVRQGRSIIGMCEAHQREFEAGREKELRERRLRAVEDRKARAGEILHEAGFWREHCAARLEDFDEKTRLAAETWIDSDNAGLLIKGSVGPGKTHLAAAIARELLIDGRRIVAVTVPDLFGRLRASFREGSGESDEEIIKSYWQESLVLVLDDLGFEGTTTALVVSALHRILSARNGEGSRTILTTNLTLGEIEKHYGPAIASRLAFLEQLVLDGPDRRRVKRTGKSRR